MKARNASGTSGVNCKFAQLSDEDRPTMMFRRRRCSGGGHSGDLARNDRCQDQLHQDCSGMACLPAMWSVSRNEDQAACMQQAHHPSGFCLPESTPLVRYMQPPQRCARRERGGENTDADADAHMRARTHAHSRTQNTHTTRTNKQARSAASVRAVGPDAHPPLTRRSGFLEFVHLRFGHGSDVERAHQHH